MFDSKKREETLGLLNKQSKTNGTDLQINYINVLALL